MLVRTGKCGALSLPSPSSLSTITTPGIDEPSVVFPTFSEPYSRIRGGPISESVVTSSPIEHLYEKKESDYSRIRLRRRRIVMLLVLQLEQMAEMAIDAHPADRSRTRQVCQRDGSDGSGH